MKREFVLDLSDNEDLVDLNKSHAERSDGEEIGGKGTASDADGPAESLDSSSTDDKTSGQELVSSEGDGEAISV